MTTNVNLTYYQKNKERIKAYAHNYYHKNKDILKRKRENYTQEKKDKISNYYKEKRNNRSEQEIINARQYMREYAKKNGIKTYLKKFLKKEKTTSIQ